MVSGISMMEFEEDYKRTFGVFSMTLKERVARFYKQHYPKRRVRLL